MAIGSAEYRPGVRERLDRVRSELDDWVQEEYDRLRGTVSGPST